VSSQRLFHLIPAEQWIEVDGSDEYEPASLASEGFVHLSTAAQVAGTAAMFFDDEPDVILLEVTVRDDDPRLKWEESIGPSGVEKFPHFYGPLPTEFITSATPWAQAQNPAKQLRRLTWQERAEGSPPLPATAHDARIRLEAGSRRFARLGEPGARHTRLVSVEAFGLPLAEDQGLPQEPYAAVLSCSDARVPVELVLGAAANELFVVRVAGNVPGRECLGSLHYAAAALPTMKVMTVLGHSGCGAVTAAVDALLQPESYLAIVHDAPLRSIVDALLAGVRLAVRAVELEVGANPLRLAGSREALIDLSVIANAAITAHVLARDLTGRDDVDVLWATYDLHRRRIGRPGEKHWQSGLHTAPSDEIELDQVLREAAKAAFAPLSDRV